jgi:DnaD/phage-associated family protein
VGMQAKNFAPQKSALQTNSRPKYDLFEIEYIVKNSPEVKYLLKTASSILGRSLGYDDHELLYSFHDYLGMSIETIVMMLEFAAKIKKTGRKNLEKMANSWAENGILTYDDAEKYVKKLEKINQEEQKIVSVIGIYGRNPSEYEKKFVKGWAQLFNFSNELYTFAYSKTIERTGKMSMSYMNKILQNWHSLGVKTEKDAIRIDENYRHNRSKKPTKSTKFSNFTKENKIDYKKIEEKILSNMMGLKKSAV